MHARTRSWDCASASKGWLRARCLRRCETSRVRLSKKERCTCVWEGGEVRASGSASHGRPGQEWVALPSCSGPLRGRRVPSSVGSATVAAARDGCMARYQFMYCAAVPGRACHHREAGVPASGRPVAAGRPREACGQRPSHAAGPPPLRCACVRACGASTLGMGLVKPTSAE